MIVLLYTYIYVQYNLLIVHFGCFNVPDFKIVELLASQSLTVR